MTCDIHLFLSYPEVLTLFFLLAVPCPAEFLVLFSRLDLWLLQRRLVTYAVMGNSPCFPLDLIKTVVCAWEHMARSADECGSGFILCT